jgi:hypothetical protein
VQPPVPQPIQVKPSARPLPTGFAGALPPAPAAGNGDWKEF